MIPDGVKTAESDQRVTGDFVSTHLKIGIDSLKQLINGGQTVQASSVLINVLLPLIQIKNLTVEFPGTGNAAPALQDISFSLIGVKCWR